VTYRPGKIVCVGRNYAAHARELGNPMPERPLLFLKPPSAVIGDGEAIVLPAASHQVEHEGEIGIVIGALLRRADEQAARAAIGGITCVNDVTARDLQKTDGQWTRAKGFDTFCPLGPALVTADEIPDPQKLRLRTLLNGEVLQDSTTADMIFTVAQIVSFLSLDTTLLPGTVILTGTPPGVGFARKPPVFLKPGDRITVEVERIGSLTNPVE